MKVTELLLSQRQEAELAFVTTLLKCKALDEALMEHSITLADRAGIHSADPLVLAAWAGMTKAAAPSTVVFILQQLDLRKATISDFVQQVQETGTADLAAILAALDMHKGGSSNHN